MNLPKKLSKRTLLLAATFAALAISLALVFHFKSKKLPAQLNAAPPAANVGNSQPPSDAPTNTDGGLPVRLKIPTINVDIALQQVGLAPDGTIDIPKSTDQVGWFNLGKRPGEIGSAVIDGHYGLENGKPSAFEDLNKLSKGDELYVQDADGTTVTFVVRELRSFDPSADTAAVFSSDDEKAHLNLITCEGVWNNVTKSYSQRLVVFTDKE